MCCALLHAACSTPLTQYKDTNTQWGRAKKQQWNPQGSRTTEEAQSDRREPGGWNRGWASASSRPQPEQPHQQPTVVVAVFDLEDKTGRIKQGAREAFIDYLTVRLAQSPRYRVVPRSQLQSLLRKQKTENYQACYDESCQIELGKALSAEMALSIRFLGSGELCVLTALLYDLRTETTEKAASIETTCTQASLLERVGELVDGLSK